MQNKPSHPRFALLGFGLGALILPLIMLCDDIGFTITYAMLYIVHVITWPIILYLAFWVRLIHLFNRMAADEVNDIRTPNPARRSVVRGGLLGAWLAWLPFIWVSQTALRTSGRNVLLIVLCPILGYLLAEEYWRWRGHRVTHSHND